MKNKQELFEAVKNEWINVPVEIPQNLIQSMPERVKSVKKAKGGHIDY